MLGGLVVLLVFQLLGDLIVRVFALPFPGPVVGMALLFIALTARRDVPAHVQATGDVLLQHLMLFLVPATVGLMVHLERLRHEWLPIVLAAVGGAAVTLGATGAILNALVVRRERRGR